MNSDLPSAASSDPVPRKHVGCKVLCVLLILGLGLAAVLYFSDGGSTNDIVWLPPGQLAKNARPGAFTQLKYRVIRVVAPLLGRFRPTRTSIQISSIFVELPLSVEAATQLPEAQSTNSDGTRVWIVQSSDLKELQARLLQDPGATSPNRPGISTANGVRAQLFTGGVPPSGTNVGSPSITIDVLPRITGGLVQLTVGIISTEFLPAPENSVREVRTNIAAACRLLLPNGGGLVLATVRTNEPSPAGYWVILSPAAVDSRGKLLKL